MAKKGRKLKLKLSAKKVHDKIKGRTHSNPETQTHDRPSHGQRTRKAAPAQQGLKPQGGIQKPQHRPKVKALLAAAPATNAVAAAAKAPAPLPYTDAQVILLVGEGNFSFSASLASQLGIAENITATALDTQEVIQDKYPDAEEHITCIRDLGGTVILGVDGTNLPACKALRDKKFQRIIFQFPHVGAGIKDQDHNILSNQRMLAGFFASAKQLLTSPQQGTIFTSSGPVPATHGEVHVTLKSGLPYDNWNITSLAKAAGYCVKACMPFKPERYPGYEHRRTLGYDETKAGNTELQDKECKTWVFADSRSMLMGKKRSKKGAEPAKQRQKPVDSDSDH